MLHSQLIIAVCMALPQEAPPVSDTVAVKAPDAAADFAAACDALVAATSYAFEVKTETLGEDAGGGGGGGRGGRGGFGGGDDGTPTTGQYQAGVPTHLVRGEAEAFVSGDTLVAKNDEGAWELVDREAMRGGRGGRGQGGGGRGGRGAGGGDARGGDDGAGSAEGGGAGKAEGGDAGKADGGGAGKAEGGAGNTDGGDARGGGSGEGGRGARGAGGRGQGGGALFAATRLQRTQLPHVLLKDAGEKVSSIVREEKDGKVILKGSLSEEAVMALAMGGGRGGRGGRGGFGGGDAGGEGPDREISGTFQLTLSGQGAIESVVIDTHVAIQFGDRAFERDNKVTYLISDIGSTEVEVPEEALIHFEF